MPATQERPGPALLMLRGPSYAVARRRGYALFALLMAGWLLSTVAILRGAVPWAASWMRWVAILIGPQLATGAFLVVFGRLHAASGTARLDEAGVVLDKEDVPHALLLEWGEIASYQDASSGYVTLVPRTGKPSSYTAIPTPTEAERVALLALLDARGLSRAA